jgi:hypothetical protein
MAAKCKHCGGPVKANMDKLKVVLGGSALVLLMGFLLATPTGWLAVIPAALAGSKQAQDIMRLKQKLWMESNKAGSYFQCDDCGRDIPLGDVFG